MGKNSYLVECMDCNIILADNIKEKVRISYTCPECGSDKKNAVYRLIPGSVSETRTFSTEPSVKVELLMQSVIEPLKKTVEGTLIKAVSLPWFKILGLIEDDPRIAFEISPEKWEEIIAGVYVQAGFDDVILTPRSGDFGRDIIATKKGVGSIRVIDQVKKYKPGNLVTANDVRALAGILDTDRASKGFITTTSDFAPKITEDPLIKPFLPHKIELINGEALFKRLKDFKKDLN